jgi:hypothetical protein
LTYADEVAALALSSASQQGHIDEIGMWLLKWRLDSNVIKSKCMIINGANENSRFTLRGQEFEIVPEYKYLGVYLQGDGGWNRQVKYMLGEMNQALGYWRSDLKLVLQVTQFMVWVQEMRRSLVALDAWLNKLQIRIGLYQLT